MSGGGAAEASALNGDWDLIVSAGGKVEAGVLVIGPTHLAIAIRGLVFDADLAGAVPDVQGQLFEGAGAAVITHAAEPLDLGQIPIGLGGKWSFRGAGPGSCDGALTPGLGTLECRNLSAPMKRWFQGYDFVEAKTLGTGTTTAQRTKVRSSIFGELGGDWKIVMPRTTCEVTFEDDQLTAACLATRYGAEQPGTLHMTFADGIASGTSNPGEVSARRR